MPGSSDMRMGWVRMMPGDGLMESLVLVLVVGRGSEGSKLGVGEGTESSSTLEIRSASEGGVGVDRARGGSFNGDVNQLGQAVLHVGVVRVGVWVCCVRPREWWGEWVRGIPAWSQGRHKIIFHI